MALPAKKDSERFSYADYLTWPDDQRWELIDGVAYNMVPAPSPRHQEVAGELFRQLADQLNAQSGPCRIYQAPFDVILSADEADDETADTVVQPDLAIVCERSRLDERGYRGAPAVVIEVVSPSSAAHDQVVKADVYERHGVREYWVAHPLERLVCIRVLGPNGTYGKTEVVTTGTVTLRTMPGISVELDRVFTAGWSSEEPVA